MIVLGLLKCKLHQIAKRAGQLEVANVNLNSDNIQDQLLDPGEILGLHSASQN